MEFNLKHRENRYATHQPVLIEILRITKGPVIEFGCGEGSTEIIHKWCNKHNRIAFSLDDNLEWLQKFKKKYDFKLSKFIYVPKTNKTDSEEAIHWRKILNKFEIKNIIWDLVFIDQSPFIARYYTLLTFKNTAKFIILHDCDYFPNNQIFGKCIKKVEREEGIYHFDDVFKYYKIYYPLKPWPYKKTGPPTLLGSNITSKLPKINYHKY